MTRKNFRILPTTFGGITYRSRREARWAVFYTHLGLPFEYEPEGYQLGDLFYLPDFWLPQQDCFAEIKGGAPSENEVTKAQALAEVSGRMVFIFFEPPDCPVGQTGEGSESAIALFPKTGYDTGYWWCECPHCGLLGIQFTGRADRLKCNCPRSAHGDKGYNYDSRRLMEAYDHVRATRFEGGRA